MTEVKIASRTCPDEFGRPRTFHYALTVDTVESDTFSCENYGVRIVALQTSCEKFSYNLQKRNGA